MKKVVAVMMMMMMRRRLRRMPLAASFTHRHSSLDQAQMMIVGAR